MATTTLLQRHAGEGETIAEAIRDCLDYGKDPEKTESGKYISAYECDPATVADEFLLAKASYAAMTGREQKKENDVLCYQISVQKDSPEADENSLYEAVHAESGYVDRCLKRYLGIEAPSDILLRNISCFPSI